MEIYKGMNNINLNLYRIGIFKYSTLRINLQIQVVSKKGVDFEHE